LDIKAEEMHCSGINDPHPWTPERHLAQRLFDKMIQDFPEADVDYLFSNSLRHCQEAWANRMTDQQKLKYIQWSQEDKLRSGKEGVSKTGGQKGSTKKPKDKNKPKKPMGAFFVFLNEKRDFIREQYPELSITEVSKKASELYGQLSVEEKQPYEDEFQELKAKYEVEIEAYNK